LGKLSEYVAHPSSAQTWDVFNNHVWGSKDAKNSGEVGPEPTLVALRFAEPGEADGLAGESSAKNINCVSGDIGLPAGDVSDVVGCSKPCLQY